MRSGFSYKEGCFMHHFSDVDDLIFDNMDVVYSDR